MSEEMSKCELFNKCEEAIKVLKNEIKFHEFREASDSLIMALKLAVEVLEKQIPKKTYFLNYGGHNVGNWNHGIACICDYKASYCRHCGQKLDWEVENELSTHKYSGIGKMY